jgi:hypothetical protein
MSPVPQLFAAVRGRLIGDPAVQDVLEKRVYFNLPEKPIYPCVVFFINNIIDNKDTCRINFNLQLLSLHQKGAEPLKTAHAIATALEETIQITPSSRATCRETSMN